MASSGTLPLHWLADVPLFISPQRIKALYHAVALPETEEEYRTISKTETEELEKGVTVAAGAKGKVGGDIFKVLPEFELSTSLEAALKKTQGNETGSAFTLRPVVSAERQLLNLCLYYAATMRDRCEYIKGLRDGDWNTPEFINGGGRALVFIDIGDDTPVIPMAAELDRGKVVAFFQSMNQEAVVWGELAPPKWPDENDSTQATDYWSWYMKSEHRDSSKQAMRLMEREIGDGGNPRWVDYRVPIKDEAGKPINSLHLHIQAGENSTTGDFAHRFVHRGRKHGLRVIGLLKEGPAINVLAVYER